MGSGLGVPRRFVCAMPAASSPVVRRPVSAALVLLLCALALTATRARALDLTGNWKLEPTVPSPLFFEGQFRRFTQTGSTLDVRSPSGTIVLAGEVDEVDGTFSTFGAFVIFFVAQCAEAIDGVAMPDGLSFTGRYRFSCPLDFIFYDVPVIGTRCDAPGATCCGNGVIDPGEVCDGACCQGCVAFSPGGTGCASDGNVCTDDVCDGQGACQHANNTAPCDDGELCSPAGQCTGGVCTPAACRTGSASINIRRNRLGDFPLKWKWKDGTAATLLGTFGDPSLASGAPFYRFCFEVPTSPGSPYVERAALGLGSGPTFWPRRTPTMLRYVSEPNAVSRAQLNASPRGVSIVVQSSLIGPLPITGPAHFRFVSKDVPGACFEVTFTSPVLNTASHYRATQ